MVIVSIVIYVNNPSTLFDEIIMSLGCSTIPTVATAYLIDRAAEKRDAVKHNELRVSFLWGMPHGLLWIAKTIIESYYIGDINCEKTFMQSYKEAIVNMEKVPTTFSDDYFKKRGLLMDRMNYGLSLCIRDCKAIIDKSFELEINSIFSKDELIVIRNLHDECMRIREASIIAEMAEYIDVFTESVIEAIPEIKEKFNRTIEMKNNYIINFNEISK